MLGRLLRAARYSTARVVNLDRARWVAKQRLFYAPWLVSMGNSLVRILGTGVQVLPQLEWEARERRLYHRLYARPIRVDAEGMMLLPCLPGKTLASLLDDPSVPAQVRSEAIERAAVALAEFHRLGFTHGDAMAENVLVDLTAGVARWFDFETVHDSHRPMAWRQADDLRALLVTCVVRTAPRNVGGTVNVVLDAYADDEVTSHVEASFTSALQRPLTFHLAQAALPFWCFREIDRLLLARLARHQASSSGNH